MKWIICIVLSIVLWSLCDILLKKSSKELKGKDVVLKYGITTGLVQFVVALYIYICRSEPITLSESFIKFWPVSLFGIVYVTVTTINYNSYRYNDVSTSSILANTSQLIGVILLILAYIIAGKVDSVWDIISIYKIISIILVVIGIILISNVRKGFIFKRKVKIGYPLMYATMDATKIVIAGLAVNKTLGFGMPDMDIAIIYGIIFGLASVVMEIVYFIRNKKMYYPVNKESLTIINAEGCDALALLFYTMAIAIDSIYTESLIIIYPILVMFISKLYLKEKLSKKEYFALGLIIIGTIILVIDGFI